MRAAALVLVLAGSVAAGAGLAPLLAQPAPDSAATASRPPPKPELSPESAPEPADAPSPAPAPKSATPQSPDPAPEVPSEPTAAASSEPSPEAPAKADSEAQPAASPAGPPEWETLRETDADFTACTQALWRLGADFTVEAPVTEAGNRDCGIARPVRIQTILPKVEIPGGAVMRCDTALALGRWLRDTVRPAGRLMPDRPELRAVLPGSTYQCRDRVGTAQTKMSEHALGNAFDVAGFRFEITRDGAAEVLDLPVIPRQDSGDMAEAFQRAVRGAACLYFTTVLGPGSNAAHDDHLHLDIRARNGGFRLCQ